MQSHRCGCTLVHPVELKLGFELGHQLSQIQDLALAHDLSCWVVAFCQSYWAAFLHLYKAQKWSEIVGFLCAQQASADPEPSPEGLMENRRLRWSTFAHPPHLSD